MSPIICIINAKGGVGKTVSTVYLAHAHTRLKAHAAMTGKTMTDLLLEFINQLED